MDLLLPGAEARKQKLLQDAERTARKLSLGADVPKHRKLDYVVVDIFKKGDLPKYIHTKKGDFTLETHDGRRFPNNIFNDLVRRKQIF